MNKHEHFIGIVGRYAQLPSAGNIHGLESYFRAIGVSPKFSAYEFVKVRRPQHLSTELRLVLPKHDGLETILLPDSSWWPRIGALALLASRMRIHTGPIVPFHTWRPESYNEAVGGSTQSDHLGAYATDFDFATKNDRIIAYKHVIEPLLDTELFEMSVGVGTKRIHVGLFAGRGQREWGY